MLRTMLCFDVIDKCGEQDRFSVLLDRLPLPGQNTNMGLLMLASK